jgi:3-oxoacyl-[acyl-carrier-protein] synthase II
MNRKGLVVGEGCGMIIMESFDAARARGAKIWGEVIGVGLSTDCYHMTSPHPAGEGAIAAMKNALNDAQIAAESIDYISAHGTGTPTNDKVETKALASVFGVDRIPPASSIKSMLGHAMGAASILEAIACLLMLEKQTILPTANYLEPDNDCRLDCVPNKPRKAKLNCVMSNAYAFGGQNSTIVIKRG